MAMQLSDRPAARPVVIDDSIEPEGDEPASCCSPTKQASCCEPEAKASCCGQASSGGCGCQ